MVDFVFAAVMVGLENVPVEQQRRLFVLASERRSWWR